MTGIAITLDEVLAATGGTAWRSEVRRFSGVAIDGRLVPRGGLWFAIQGERHDGHDFAAQAVHTGAAGLVVRRGRAADLDLAGLSEPLSIIEVDDTVAALGRLGRARRLALPELTVVGVTGSNGKTSTKELCAAILAAAAGPEAVHKTSGNYNNHLGVPLTLLGLHAGHRYAVVEMGMSALGEIAYLADLARPQVGIVVNVGPVHLEQLGSLENIARAKGELLVALSPAGTAIWPDGDERIQVHARAARAVRQLRFGTRPGVEVRCLEVSVDEGGTRVLLRLPDGEHVEARLRMLGAHHARNAAAAAAAAYALGIDARTIGRGLAMAASEKHRSAVVEVGGRHVLDDCYNASPLSVPAALDTLGELRVHAAGPRRQAVALLGDMLELGPDAPALHREMGAHAARAGVDLLLAIGPHGRYVVAGARDAGLERAREVADVSEAIAALRAETAPGDFILVKASRGMRLERVIDGLQAALAPAPSTSSPSSSPSSPAAGEGLG